MARLRLRDTETRAGRLPEMCMVCGEPSNTTIKKSFSWYPPLLGLLVLVALIPGLIVIAILTKKMTVDIPVCDRHRGHFWKRTLMTWLALLGWLGITAVTFGIAIALSDGGRGGGGGDASPMIGCMAFIVGLIAAIIVIAIVQHSGIRPKEITERDITLVGVHDKFVDAFEAEREERRSRRDEDDDEDDDRPRRRPRAEIDDRPPPRRLPRRGPR